jgi:putative transposase
VPNGKKTLAVLARDICCWQKNFTGQHFWVRGYFVSTVGLDKKTIRDYIQNQENDDKRKDQLDLMAEKAATRRALPIKPL